jgi:hypothetical protein
VAQAVRERRNDVHLSLLSREFVDNTGRVLRALKQRVEEVRGVPYLGKASPSSGFVGVYLLLQVSLPPHRRPRPPSTSASASWRAWRCEQ